MNRELIAILRGVRPDEVVGIGRALVAAGITRIEVPLNSPDPFSSIAALAKDLRGTALVGAGTVLSAEFVERVAAVGGRLIVAPDCNPAVIRSAKARRLTCLPGIMTPTEAFLALRSGADGLKLFPGDLIGVKGYRAMRAVLPEGTKCYAISGVDPSNLAEWIAAGVTGFGLGSALYKPGMDAQTVSQRAEELVSAYDAAKRAHRDDAPASGHGAEAPA